MLDFRGIRSCLVPFWFHRHPFLPRSSIKGTRSGTSSYWNAFHNALNFVLGMKFPQPIPEFIKGKMLFVTKLNIKGLYLDEKQNGIENVIKNLFEISYVNALKLHSILASFYFAKKIPLPSKPFLKVLILKISFKVQRTYLKVTQNRKIQPEFVGKLVKYAFYCVLKQKYSSFYKDQKIPFVKKSDLPLKMLQECILTRKTNKIVSHAFQRF